MLSWLTPTTIVTEVNVWFLDKVGLKREDIVGKSLWDLHPDTEGTARVRAALDALRRGKRRENAGRQPGTPRHGVVPSACSPSLRDNEYKGRDPDK